MPLKNQHSDKDKDIHRQQSSPAAVSCFLVIQTLPSTFVEVTVARVVVVAMVVMVVWQWQGWWQ